jgi:tetratricopeptide (TPR) repeat protein
MSVVNDVLKNLDQRQSQRQVSGGSPFFYEQERSNNRWLWFGLVLAIACCSIMAAFIYVQYSVAEKELSHQVVPLEMERIIYQLPEDLFISEAVEQELNAVITHELNDFTVNNNQDISTFKNQAVKKPETDKPVIKKQPLENSKQVIAKKTQASEASESVVAAINSGNSVAARSNLEQASRKVQEEVQLRLLLKDNPAQVFSRIKSKYRDYRNNPTLLALAAQGEQRAGFHNSAVQLYKALIPLEPEQSKWRAGLAISLEGLGDTVSAKRLYELALSMNNLPGSLRRFSEIRLKRLSL